jgi:hypothetical protein
MKRGEKKYKKPAQIVDLETKVWADSCRFMSLRAIGEKHGISYVQAHRIIKRVALRHRNTQEEDKGIYTGRLETILTEAFDRWLKSYEPRTRVVEKVDENVVKSTVTYVDEQPGDVAFLNAVMGAIDRIFRLNGLGVADATQELGGSIAQLKASLIERGKLYRKAKKSSPGDPQAASQDVPEGDQPVREEPGPIQHDSSPS